MHNDERGYAMTTGSAAAAAQLDGAIHNFVHWKAAVMPGLKGAVEADPGFALAHAVNGLMLHGARAVGRSRQATETSRFMRAIDDRPYGDHRQ